MIVLKNTDYPVFVGAEEVLLELGTFLKNQYADASIFILGDSNTIKKCLPKIEWLELEYIKQAEVIEIDPGEGSKNIEIYYQLVETLLNLGADRKSLIINLGGGVVSDIGGFLASTFKRGIDYINIPTSLLAMVDASIGGKTGLNSKESKNQIGTFYNPKAVFVADVFLETLPEEQKISGLGEMLKHILISDKNGLKSLENLSNGEIKNQLPTSIQTKIDIVNADFKELGERKKLNYGHTFGHAIESYLMQIKKPISHGKAVLIGMAMENRLAYQKGLLTNKEYSALSNYLFSNFNLSSAIGLINKIELIKLLAFDKKNKNNKIVFSLIGPIGNCNIDSVSDKNEIEKCINFFIDKE